VLVLILMGATMLAGLACFVWLIAAGVCRWLDRADPWIRHHHGR
jgi:type IV secretory pathway TrbD component